jgi:hypothetical protein
LKVTCSIELCSSKFSSKFCNLYDPGHPELTKMNKKYKVFSRTAHHHCQAVTGCGDLNILICHQFSQFASFKYPFDIPMSSTHRDATSSTCSILRTQPWDQDVTP